MTSTEIFGILRNPDRTRTRIRTKPGLDTRTYLPKKPDLSPQNPDSINKTTEFKTGLIKKRGFTPVFKITRPKKI